MHAHVPTRSLGGVHVDPDAVDDAERLVFVGTSLGQGSKANDRETVY